MSGEQRQRKPYTKPTMTIASQSVLNVYAAASQLSTSQAAASYLLTNFSRNSAEATQWAKLQPVAEHPQVDGWPEKAMIACAGPVPRIRPLSGRSAVGGVNPAALFRVLGRSMEPTLRSGDLLEGAGCAVADLHEGDLVVMQDHPSALEALEGEPAIIVHRLLGKVRTEHGYRLRTRGDNRLADDREFTEREFVGRVVRIWCTSDWAQRPLVMDARRNRWHALLGRAEARALQGARGAKLRLFGSRLLPGAMLLARVIHGVIRGGHLLVHSFPARSADASRGRP